MQFETYGGFLPGRRVQIEPWAELAASDPGAKWTEGSHRGGIGHVVTEGHFKGLRGSRMSVHRPCVSPGQENKMRRTSLFFFFCFLLNQTDSGILFISVYAESISMNIWFYYYFVSRCVGV